MREKEEEKEKKNRDREQTVRNKERRSGGTRCRVRDERRGEWKDSVVVSKRESYFPGEEPFFSCSTPSEKPP